MSNTPPKSNTPAKAPNPQSEKKENLDIVEAIKGELVDVLPKRRAEEISLRIGQLVVSEYYSGPLPHPRHLSQYDELIPNGADRVMNMAETAMSHNQGIEKSIVDCEIHDRNLGMWMGFGVFVLLVACAVFIMVYLESIPGGSLFLGAAVISAVGLFIKGRNGN